MEKEHACTDDKATSRTPWNKGKLIGAKPPAAKPRVVDQNQTSNAGAQKRSYAIQPRHRQQAARL